MKIEEAKKCYYACIYCLEFPNGKKYVGKTKNLSSRIGLYLRFGGSNKLLSEAISEFGWDNVEIRVLSRIDCKDKIDLDVCLSILEIKYIREVGSLSPNGCNISLGGECLGIPVSSLTTDKDAIKRFSDGSKAVLLYDKQGELVNEFPSIARMSYDLSLDEDLIRGLIDKKKLLNGKWYLRKKKYDYAPKCIEVDPPFVCENVIYKDVVVERERIRYKDVIVRREVEKIIEKERKVTKKQHILRYDMNGDFCGEYDSMKDACRSFTSSASGIACGVYRNGYILFKKGDGEIPQKIEPYHVLKNKVMGDYYRPASELEDKSKRVKPVKESMSKKRGRPKNISTEETTSLRVYGKYTNINNVFKVEQYDLNGVLVATYDSIRDASSDTGINYANIWACVMGRTKKAHGFVWKRAD